MRDYAIYFITLLFGVAVFYAFNSIGSIDELAAAHGERVEQGHHHIDGGEACQRQIASKVNTAFLSLWAVCVLLFFSITVFSSGMGFVEVFVGGVEKANPYQAVGDELLVGVGQHSDGHDEHHKAHPRVAHSGPLVPLAGTSSSSGAASASSAPTWCWA